MCPASMSWKGWVVLAMAGAHVSTPAAYARCTPQGPESHHQELAGLLQAEDADTLRPLLRNGLESAVFAVAPDVGRVYATVSALLGRALRVSGAGSVLFDICDTPAEANGLAERIREAGLNATVAPAPVTGV